MEQTQASGTPAGLFCIVRWQEILSPSYYPLERPPASGTEPWLYLERPQGVSKKPLLHTRYTRIVEVMWSNRGAFVERGFLFVVPENLGFLGRGGDAERCKSQTRDESFVSDSFSDDS